MSRVETIVLRTGEKFRLPGRLGEVVRGGMDFRRTGHLLPDGYGKAAGERWLQCSASLMNPEIPSISQKIGLVESPDGQRHEIGIFGWNEYRDRVPIVHWGGYQTRIKGSENSLSIVSGILHRPVVAFNPPGYGHSDRLTIEQLKAFIAEPSEGFRSVGKSEAAALLKLHIQGGIFIGESMGAMFAMAGALESGIQLGSAETEKLILISPRLTHIGLPELVKGILHAQRENYYNPDDSLPKGKREKYHQTLRGIFNTLAVPLHDKNLRFGRDLTAGCLPQMINEYSRANPGKLEIWIGTNDELNNQGEMNNLLAPTGALGRLHTTGEITIRQYPDEGHAMMVNPWRLGNELRRFLPN